MPFVLASQSQRRQQLLKYLIDDFEVITADINEEELGKLARTPQEMVMGLAKAKVNKIWEYICSGRRSATSTDQTVILGADTTVIIPDGDSWQAIGKPKDKQDAKQMLQRLRRNKHQVYTGICLIISKSLGSENPIIINDYDMSTVTFGDFSDQAIDDYIATGTVMDKAGAYAVQDIGKEFRISVEGSYSNVVGLPMELITALFDTYRIDYNKNWKDYLQTKNGKA